MSSFTDEDRLQIELAETVEANRWRGGRWDHGISVTVDLGAPAPELERRLGVAKVALEEAHEVARLQRLALEAEVERRKAAPTAYVLDQVLGE